MPRVINVDKNPSLSGRDGALKADGARSGALPFCASAEYLNNVIEQDHRTVKRRSRLAMGYK